MATVQFMERCPACRARLGAAEVCSRCGTDFSMTRQAERQAQALARLALQQLAQAKTVQAGATAHAACNLANSPLARAVAHMVRHQTAINAADTNLPPTRQERDFATTVPGCAVGYVAGGGSQEALVATSRVF
jgi:hypothetical protein